MLVTYHNAFSYLAGATVEGGVLVENPEAEPSPWLKRVCGTAEKPLKPVVFTELQLTSGTRYVQAPSIVPRYTSCTATA